MVVVVMMGFARECANIMSPVTARADVLQTIITVIVFMVVLMIMHFKVQVLVVVVIVQLGARLESRLGRTVRTAAVHISEAMAKVLGCRCSRSLPNGSLV
jgi:hypothetical protein